MPALSSLQDRLPKQSLGSEHLVPARYLNLLLSGPSLHSLLYSIKSLSPLLSFGLSANNSAISTGKQHKEQEKTGIRIVLSPRSLFYNYRSENKIYALQHC